MANHKSAEKRALQSEKSRIRNRSHLSKVKTAIKAFRASLSKDGFSAEVAQKRFVDAQSALQKVVTKGVLHRNNASRRIGRLAQSLKKAMA